MENIDFAKILIVDDEPANIFFLNGVLTEEGFETSTAENGPECLAKLKYSKPDLILLDIMMPEMDGLEVLKNIKKNEDIKNIPVVMVTAKTNSEDVENALNLGAVDYIKKPIDEVELLARIRSVLRIKFQEDKLKEMLKAKDEFIKIISHDVRSPFTSISGLAQLLVEDKNLMKKLNAEQKETIKLIIDSTEYTVNYFNKLLSWSNLGSSEIILKKQKNDFSKIINTTLMIYKRKMDEKNITFLTEYKPGLLINVDDTYFSQAINNIILNSIKFTQRGGSIKVVANEAAITISDSGIGIDKNTQAELFNKSINESKRGTEGEKGTGIGLNICKKILDAHGFQISIKSEVNKGTTFTINLK